MISGVEYSRIDFSSWVDLPPEKEFIVEDWLSVGDVSYLSGDSEVGKSLLAQQLMTAAATGKPWLNMNVKQVKTYGVFCTDEMGDLIRKQCAINRLYQLDADSPDLTNNVRLFSRAGEDNALMVFDDSYTGRLTPYFHELLEDIKSFQPKLVVLDEDLDFFGGDKNNNHQRREFIKCCAHIAKAVGCAVLLCKQDANMEILSSSSWYLFRSEEAKDERIFQCGRLSHLLRYQDEVFVI